MKGFRGALGGPFKHRKNGGLFRGVKLEKKILSDRLLPSRNLCSRMKVLVALFADLIQERGKFIRGCHLRLPRS